MGILPLPNCELFQVHGSKFKPHPIRYMGQACVSCISHTMLCLGFSKDLFNGFLAHLVVSIVSLRIAKLLRHIPIRLPNVLRYRFTLGIPHLLKNWKPSCLGHPISSKNTRYQTPMLTKVLSRLAADLKHEVCRFGCYRAIIEHLQKSYERRHQIGIRTAAIQPACRLHSNTNHQQLPELDRLPNYRRPVIQVPVP